MTIKVTIRAVIGEDRQLTIVAPEEIPVGQVHVTITPLREKSDEDDGEFVQLLPGSPDISLLIDENRGER